MLSNTTQETRLSTNMQDIPIQCIMSDLAKMSKLNLNFFPFRHFLKICDILMSAQQVQYRFFLILSKRGIFLLLIFNVFKISKRNVSIEFF
jgi:hypothetical protein